MSLWKVIEYKIFGLEYKAFVSGCDQGASVSGVSHRVFEDYGMFGSQEFQRDSLNVVGRVLFQTPAILRPLLTLLGSVFFRIWAKIPIIGVAGGAFAGYKKILQPWMDSQSASADWERQREHEALMDEETVQKDDFFDSSGAAKAYFVRNRDRILNALGGDARHEEGDWYKDWQNWARNQWEQQQQQQQQQTSYQQQRQQQRARRNDTRSSQKEDYKWDFDPNDPYSVLGIRRGATKAEVSAAFRKQMLLHHPDTQPNASEAKKRRLVERSKYITEAYRKIKAEMK